MRRRLIILIVMIGAIAYWPWWFSGLLALVAIWRFDSSYELLLPAMLVDLAYGTPLTDLLNFAFPTTVLMIVIIALSKVLVNRFFLRP